MKHLLCFGVGYSSQVIAARLMGEGWQVSGTTRSSARAAEFEKLGCAAHVFDGSEPRADVARALQTTTHLLTSVPPTSDGDPVLIHHAADIAASPALKWIGYFSSIAVYGNAHGGWIDENSVANPASDRGKRRLLAEMAWLELGQKSHKRAMVFRLPGIYGPGRSALDDLKAGTARRIVKPDQVFNRIHVDDIANAVIAAIDSSAQAHVFNVTDDEPAPPQDVVAYAASLLAMPPPPQIGFDNADLTPMARSFYAECKRVSNTRMKTELGVVLTYPNYREGLRAIVEKCR